MTSIINVLTGSLALLRKRPVFFVPKLVSTALGAAWFIGLLSGTGPLYVYLATAPVLVVLGVFVSVMLAAMVKRKDSDEVLRAGFRNAYGRWRELLASAAVFMLIGFALYVPFAAGFAVFYIYGTYIPLLVGAAVSLFLLLAASFLVYFFPISLVEKGSVIESFRDSAGTSVENGREVFALTLLSFAILGAASLTGDTGMKALGYAGFFVMRIVSGVVTTYVFVVSPSYYLQS